MKLYLSIVGWLTMQTALWGFALPALISASSTVSVLVGLAVIVAMIPAAFIWGKNIVSDIVSKFEKKEN